MSSRTIIQPPQLEAKSFNFWYVWLVACVAAISGFLFGFDTAVINGALVFLRRQFALSSFSTEVAASALLLGCLIGAASAGVSSDNIGRRKSLMASAFLFTLSAIGSALAPGFLFFSIARLTGGLAIGLASALTPTYISEVAPQQSRGRLVSLNQLAIVIGILVAYLTNWRLSNLGDVSWRWMFGVAAVPSFGFLLGLLFIPESPRWLIARGRREEAFKVLSRIAGATEAKVELTEIDLALAQTSNDRNELFAPETRKRVYVAVALAILCQISGINTVLYYGSVLFTEHFRGESAKAALGANVAVGLVNLLCTVVAMLFIDRWGRRGLFLLASGGMTLSLSVLAVALRFTNISPVIVFSSVLFYVAFFAVGLGPGVWVYIAEIFPTRIRGRATSLATSALWAACLAVTFTFLSIVETLGSSGAFFLYAALSFITFVFVYFWVPETHGKSLEELQHTWGS